MKDNQRQYWENAIIDMNPDNKLELAEILIRELCSDEINSRDSENYDEQLSLKLKSILEKYTSQEDVIKDKKNILKVFDKFTKLSSKSRKEIMDLFVPNFLRLVNKAVEKDLISDCGEKGHQYNIDDWHKDEWTTYEETIIDHERATFPVHHVMWSRECPNCGFVEKSEDEPRELKERRLKIRKQKRIQRLKTELSRLKEN